MTAAWGQLEDTLLGGRLRECERLAAVASRRWPGEAAPALLGVAACREQGRFAEAELRLRGVLADHPSCAAGQALLAAVLADLGRDADARRQLDELVAGDVPPAAAAPAAEAAAALRSPEHAAALAAPLAGAGAGWFGSPARHRGLVDHVVGGWEAAEAHFRVALAANAAAGAPVQVAHTRRDYAALLRARGDPGDWELAVDLLTVAAGVYRRLGVGSVADSAEALLRRSQDPGAGEGEGANAFRRTAGGWELAYDGRHAVLPGAGAGLDHIAALLATPGRAQHAAELATDAAGLATEYRARLADLEGEAAGAGDPLASAMARAEADALVAELDAGEGDPSDAARRLVALRIRVALDRVDAALPGLGHHLRRSITTGTFCVYEPERLRRWDLSPR